jgi:hypothetical protein
MTQPVYSATEIKKMCLTVDVSHETFQLISDIIEEDFHLYSDSDLVILMEASMIMFARCMLISSLNILNKYQN